MSALVRLRSYEQLPRLSVRCYGRRWRQHWDIRLNVIDLEPDVRERCVEEIRPDIAAMWSDPRERMGLR